MHFDFVEIDSPEQRDEIYRLRYKVHFAAGTYLDEFSNQRWIDEHDDHAIQFATKHDGVIIAAARLSIHPKIHDGPFGAHFSKKLSFENQPIAFFSRLIVSEAYRNKGIASTLDSLRINRAIAEGAKKIVVATSNPLRHEAFARIGFQMVSNEGECELNPNVWGTLFAMDLINECEQL